MIDLGLNPYQTELLSILNTFYPKGVSENKLLALISDKDPRKIRRELNYLEGHQLVERNEVRISWPLPFSGEVPLRITRNLVITVQGIDIIGKSSKATPIESTGKVNQPIAFVSASFDDEVDPMIRWVRNRAENVGLATLWLKEIYKTRPTLQKIDEAIRDSDCLIQILTSQVFAKNGEAGWIGNELGMAYNSSPGGSIAVLVEKGYQASGMSKFLTDIVTIDPHNLAAYEKPTEKYLSDLLKTVEKKRAPRKGI